MKWKTFQKKYYLKTFCAFSQFFLFVVLYEKFNEKAKKKNEKLMLNLSLSKQNFGKNETRKLLLNFQDVVMELILFFIFLNFFFTSKALKKLQKVLILLLPFFLVLNLCIKSISLFFVGGLWEEMKMLKNMQMGTWITKECTALKF